MGRHYTQLGIEDRCELARLYAQGCSLRQIASALDRAPATIARELKRHSSHQQGYRPRYAQEQARARRWGGAHLDRDAALRAQVLARLKHGWSPEQLAGRLRREAGHTVIAHETVYRFIYAQTTRTKPDRAWRHCLPRAKWRRGWRGRRGGSAATHISRRRPLPTPWRQTVTFDNGTEFARHHRLRAFGIEPFCCDPHAPWQKGRVENAIGRLRRGLPRQTDLTILSETRFTPLLQLYNNTPRKCLDYRTPAEIFWQKVLHFKCESTFPRGETFA